MLFCLLRIIEVGNDVFDRKVRRRNRFWSNFVFPLQLLQECAQGIAVRMNGVLTTASLLSQVVAKEVLDMARNVRFRWLHAEPPLRDRRLTNSLRFVHCSIKAGTAVKYQYVDANVAWPRYTDSSWTALSMFRFSR